MSVPGTHKPFTSKIIKIEQKQNNISFFSFLYSWENASTEKEVGDDNRENSPKVATGVSGRKYNWVKMGFTECTKTCLGGVVFRPDS